MNSWRNGDTLVPARYVIDLVNTDRSFKAATKILDFGVQGQFRLVQGCGLERIPHIKRVCDFIVSMYERMPWYFKTDKEGNHTEEEAVHKQRAVKMLISMARDSHRPILEKYAGPSYFKNEFLRQEESAKILHELGIREVQR